MEQPEWHRFSQTCRRIYNRTSFDLADRPLSFGRKFDNPQELSERQRHDCREKLGIKFRSSVTNETAKRRACRDKVTKDRLVLWRQPDCRAQLEKCRPKAVDGVGGIKYLFGKWNDEGVDILC